MKASLAITAASVASPDEGERPCSLAQTQPSAVATPSVAETQATLRARARALANVPSAKTDIAEALTVVAFRLADERYAVASAYVREIVPLKMLTPIPCTPAFLLGIVNLHGQIIAVVDLKKFLELPEKGLADTNRLLVLHTPQLEVGLVAEAILGVDKISVAQLRPPFQTLSKVSKEFISGVTPDGITLLAAERLLADKRLIVQAEVPCSSS
ncbi:MAG: purine-binding chemotaxis protein CheW [Caldilineaceae bacterium]|nr:purine-binding chemotaxis protein CheW [Caldilineaceae bacterium]